LFGLGFQVIFAFPFFWLMETKAPGLIMLAICARLRRTSKRTADGSPRSQRNARA
jgi:hypothetical protein